MNRRSFLKILGVAAVAPGMFTAKIIQEGPTNPLDNTILFCGYGGFSKGDVIINAETREVMMILDVKGLEVKVVRDIG